MIDFEYMRVQCNKFQSVLNDSLNKIHLQILELKSLSVMIKRYQ